MAAYDSISYQIEKYWQNAIAAAKEACRMGLLTVEEQDKVVISFQTASDTNIKDWRGKNVKLL